MNAGGVYSQELSINKYIHHLHVQRIIIPLSWEKISATRQSRTQNDRQRYGCDIYHTKFNSYFKTRTRSINSDRLENHNFFFSSIYFLSYESKHAHLRSFKNKGNPCRRIKKTGFVKRTVFFLLSIKVFTDNVIKGYVSRSLFYLEVFAQSFRETKTILTTTS